MAGYTNSFTKVNGELIDAPTFQQEYTALGDAFDVTGGHKHDGSSPGEGALIALIGASANEVLCDGVGDQIVFSVNVGAVKTAQASIADGAILPDTTNDVDLGSTLLQFKDIHSSGTANLTTLDVSGTSNLTNLDVTGTADFAGIDATGTATLATLEVTGVASLDGGIDVDETGSVFSVDGTTGDTLIAGTLGAGAGTLADLTLATGITADSILDDGTMAASSSTALVSQASVVSYVINSTLDGGSF